LREAHDAKITAWNIRGQPPYASYSSALRSSSSVLATVLRSPNLRDISIGDSDFEGDWGAYAYGSAVLRAMQSAGRADDLHGLHLYGLGTPIAVTVTDDLSVSIRPFTALRTVSINCFEDPSAARSILAAVGSPLPHLTSFRLMECSLMLSGPALSSALDRMPMLEDLSFNTCDLSVEAAAAIRHAPSALRRFKLTDFTYNGPHEVLATSINALIPRLEELDLTYCTGVMLGAGAGIVKLELIDPSYAVPTAFINDLAALTSLRSLKVGHADLDYFRLAAALSDLTGLTELFIMWGQIGADAATVLASTLVCLSDLRSLTMAQTSLRPESVAALAGALGRLTGLEKLCLCECTAEEANAATADGGFGSEGAAELATALERMPCLTSVNLHSNNIGPAGLAAIAPSLAALTGLIDLDLSGNKLAGHGRHAALRTAVKALTRLTGLDLKHNGLSADFFAELW